MPVAATFSTRSSGNAAIDTSKSSSAPAVPLAVTVPDPTAARRTVEQVRALALGARVFVRARYHLHRNALAQAGAEIVVDEETLMGEALADVLATALGETELPLPR